MIEDLIIERTPQQRIEDSKRDIAKILARDSTVLTVHLRFIPGDQIQPHLSVEVAAVQEQEKAPQ